MNLTVVALDLSSQDDYAVVVDQFHDANLIGSCLIVDLQSKGDWRAAWPGELPVDLPTALSREMWTRIAVVSVRDLLSRDHPTNNRVRAEEQLFLDLTSMYGGSVPIVGVTLSQIGHPENQTRSLVHDAQFPQNYVTNFLHEPFVETDPGLPLAPITEEKRSATLIFVALTATSCGKWGTADVLAKVGSPTIGSDREVRFIRVLSRIAMLPPIVGETVRVAVRPGGGAIPADAGVVVPMDSHPDLVRRVAKQFIERYSFSSIPFEITADPPKAVRWYKALIDLFVQLPRYLKRAAHAEWQDRVSSITMPLKRRLEDLAFGEGSRFIIDGVPHDASVSSMTRLSIELKTRLEGLDGIVSPIPTPATWTALMQTSFALLDASEFPEGIDAPNAGGRVLFLNPNVVGPALDHEFFSLSDRDCEVLEYPTDAPRKVGIFDTVEVEKMKVAVTRASEKVEFRAALLEKKRAEEEEKRRAIETEKTSSARLRGTLSREERIAVKSESGSAVTVETVEPLRLPKQIAAELTAWDDMRKLVSRDSFIAVVSETLNNSVDEEFHRMKWEDVIKEAEALLEPPEHRKIGFRRLFRVFGILLAVLLTVAFLLSSVFGVVLAVLGVPLLLFAGIIWMTSFGFALLQSIVNRALELRRWDLKGLEKATLFIQKYHSVIHSINEFRRLELLRMQFGDWQRLVRELAHYPYGKLRDSEHSVIPIDEEDVPPQLVLAKAAVDSQSQIRFRHYVHQQLRTRGFLSTIASTMESLWREEYERANVGVAPSPRQDISAPDLTPGVVLGERTYLFPRRDFVSRGIESELRERLVSERVASLDSHFKRMQISEILGTIDAGELRRAYRNVTPTKFLRDIAISPRRIFFPEIFDPSIVGQLRTDNIDADASFSSSDGSTIGEFFLDQDDDGLLLGSTRIDVSKKVKLNQLVGYHKELRESGKPDERTPDRPRS